LCGWWWHAFALISDEVDASLVFVLRYGLNLREFLEVVAELVVGRLCS
jgi:hypothetical protein